MLEVGERIRLGQDGEKTNVDEDDLHSPGDKGRCHKQTNVGESLSKVALLSDARDDQGKDGEGRQENDPVDDTLKNLVHLSQDSNKLAILQWCQSGSEDSSKEQDGCELAAGKCGHNVVWHDLFEDTLVNSVRKRHLGDSLLDLDTVNLGIVEFNEHEGRHGSKEGGGNSGEKVQTNNSPSNGGGLADVHHINDGGDNVDKDEWEDEALQCSNEKVANETEPLDRHALDIGVLGCPEGEANSGAYTDDNEDEDGHDRMVDEKSRNIQLSLVLRSRLPWGLLELLVLAQTS